MQGLETFGRGYATVGAIFGTILGVLTIWLGRYIASLPPDDKDPNPERTGKVLVIVGIIVIIAVWAMRWLAQTYDSVAAVEGLFLIVMIITSIIGAFKYQHKTHNL
jgi:amino acid transporter